jgi:hypothetical protein
MNEHKHQLWDSLNELRLIVLMEMEDGTWRQILLDGKQFKKVSDACVYERVPEEGLRDNFEKIGVVLGDEEYDGKQFEHVESITTDFPLEGE